MKFHKFKRVGEEIVFDGVRVILIKSGSGVKIGLDRSHVDATQKSSKKISEMAKATLPKN